MQRLSVWLRWIAGWQLVGEFTEVESGKHSDRPQLAAALAACKKQRAKLVIAKLDRKHRYGPKFQHLWISLEGQSFLSPARRRAKPRWPRSRRAGGGNKAQRFRRAELTGSRRGTLSRIEYGKLKRNHA